MAVGSVAPHTAKRDDDEIVIPLSQEMVDVSIKEVVTGAVEVSTITHLHDVSIDEQLISQHANIDRVQIGTFVDAAPEVREEDGVLIIPVVEEVAVVVRRLVLKEEIRVRLDTTKHRHQETVTVRQQEAVVRRTPAAPLTDALRQDGVLSVEPEEIIT